MNGAERQATLTVTRERMCLGKDEPVVEVLLATYNGERFLHEQIDSILSQDYPGIRILARDDGSCDGTVAILEEYARSNPARFRVQPQGEPTGGAKINFLRLMEAATAEFICFADQDDVWLPGKVRTTIEALLRLQGLHGSDTACLVFTDLRVVDDRLRTLHDSMWSSMGVDPDHVNRLERLLGQNVVTGCTAMINREMLHLARCMPEQATMHDRWIALLSASMGAAAAIREPTVLYRQHDRNVVGAICQNDSLAGIVKRSRDPRRRRLERWLSEQQAQALFELHGAKMSPKKREILKAYIISGSSESRFERVGITLRYGFFRSGLLRNLATLLDLWRTRSSVNIQDRS